MATAFERGVSAGTARERGEVLVDVEVERSDETNLMQRTLTGQFGSLAGGEGDWMNRMHRLQVELGQQPVDVRNGNIEGLRSRLDRDAGVESSQRETLVAVLVAMAEPGEASTVGDVGWQLRMWNSLFDGCGGDQPGSSTDVFRRVYRPPEQSDKDLEDMAADECDLCVQKDKEKQVAEPAQQERENEEAAELEYRMSLQAQEEPLRRLPPGEYKQWEDWEWHNVVAGPAPPRRRTTMVVTMEGKPSADGPWLSRSMRIPVNSGGDMPAVNLRFQFEKEDYPDDVGTLKLEQPVAKSVTNPDEADTIPYATVPDPASPVSPGEEVANVVDDAGSNEAVECGGGGATGADSGE